MEQTLDEVGIEFLAGESFFWELERGYIFREKERSPCQRKNKPVSVCAEILSKAIGTQSV